MIGGSRESGEFWYNDWDFGGKEHWGANTTNGVKQGTSRDADS